MSHFTVLVPANDDQQLSAMLQPFHEYECTGVRDKYVVWVDSHEEMLNDYKVHNSDPSVGLDEFVEDWSGYSKNSSGRFGRFTNPNSKWDWWVIGGRWSNLLKLKCGQRGDFALAGDVDWDEMLNDELARLRSWHQRASHWVSMGREAKKSNEFIASRMDKFEKKQKNKYFKSTFGTLDDFLAYEMAQLLSKSDDNDPLFFLSYPEIQHIFQPENMYIAQNGGKAQTYAFVDCAGNWNQRGEMIWFGMSDEERGTPAYDEQWWGFVKNLPANQRVYVVDCHV